MEIGRFRVVGELGRGAMGVVYRALDPKIGRTLAIKSIRLSELTDLEERSRMRERLFREAQSAGILSHPNIVTIYDVSEEGGMAYIFMEFVNGLALDDLLRSDPAPPGSLVMDLLSQTAAALDYAHKNGIIHRDIKPANIMVHEGRTAKVCDFGVAKIVSQQMTQAGLLMGTPSYMSPEQIEGRTMDGRSDQFALAVMVFDILTKEKPFAGDSLPVLLYKICRADPPSASSLNTTLGIWVDPVLRKALAKNPNDRYPNCEAFIAELRRALDERPGWMLPGKGFPGDDTTTGSGHHQPDDSEAETSGAIPIPLTKGSSAASVRSASLSAETVATPAARPAPAPQPPQFANQSGNPAAPPQAPVQPSSQSYPAFSPTSTASTPAEGIPLPRPRVEQKRTNPLLYIVPILALLGGGGYFVYQKFWEPKPVTVERPPDAAAAASPKPDGAATPTPDKPSPAGPKPEVVSPPVLPPQETKSQPAAPQTPVAPAGPATTKPTAPAAAASGPFEVRFAGSPAGANVVVDGDSSTSCKTPCAIPLPRGRHNLIATLDGYRVTQRSFDVTGGDTSVPVDLVEAVGFLFVTSTPPGAAIQVNGQERSEKTPATLRLKPGTYQIVIVAQDGRRDSSAHTVKDGSTTTLNVDFP